MTQRSVGLQPTIPPHRPPVRKSSTPPPNSPSKRRSGSQILHLRGPPLCACLPLHASPSSPSPAQAPLPLHQLASLETGPRPGELLVRSVPGHCALLRALRDRQALSERVEELLRTCRAEASLASPSPQRRHRRPSLTRQLSDQLVDTREETRKQELAATMLQTLQRGRTARRLVERQHGR